MAEYHNFVLTEEPFEVNRPSAFLSEMGEFADVYTDGISRGRGGLEVVQGKDGKMWIGGTDVDFSDGETSVLGIISDHIKSGQKAVIKEVGHVKLANVEAYIYTVTSTAVKTKDVFLRKPAISVRSE